MNLRKISCVWLLGCSICLPAVAATTKDVGNDDALFSSSRLSRLSAGFDYGYIRRDVDPKNGPTLGLKGQHYSGMLGYDVFRGITLLGTLGASQAKLPEDPGWNDVRFNWSLGVQANLWRFNEGVDISAWNLTLQTLAEYAWYDSGSEGQQIRWSDVYVAIPLKYKLTFAHASRGWSKADFKALSLYAGPAFSFVNGEFNSYGPTVDFTENQTWGVMGGLTIHMLESLSFGAQMDYFDTASVTVSLRYHFR